MAIVLGGNLHGHFFFLAEDRRSATATIFSQVSVRKKAYEKEWNKIERKN